MSITIMNNDYDKVYAISVILSTLVNQLINTSSLAIQNIIINFN
jgi:hypothetical protein